MGRRRRGSAVLAAALVGAAAALGAVSQAAAQSAPAVRTVKASSGTVSAELASTGGLGGDGRASLVITRAGELFSFPRLIGTGWYAITEFGNRPLRVRDLDRDGEPEVVADLYSGGAHCCTTSVIARWNPTTGRYALQRHEWLDAYYKLADLGGDGRIEFVSRDARFAYALDTSYAGGGQPLQIWRYQGGRLADVSRAFPAQLSADMRRWWNLYKLAVRRDYEIDGALGAFVADAVRLGRRTAALNRVRAVYKGPKGARFLRQLNVQLRHLGYIG